MAAPTLTPSQTTSAVTLPATGSTDNVTSTALPFGIYLTGDGSESFTQGAKDQVAYTYKKLGGDVLDIELTEGNVYAAYEESVLEYSYIVNIHQTKNILSDVLGNTTGTFDHDGELRSGDPLSSSYPDENIALKFPKIKFEYAKRIGHGFSTEVNIGGLENVYSASFAIEMDKQDYDLQEIIKEASKTLSDASAPFYNNVDDTRVTIKKVYFKTPSAVWRFYGYYGGLNTVGNLQNYGQWADDSQFQIIPVWQNKLQAKGFESAIYTRNSHYSYELKNNNLRLFPPPTVVGPRKMWIEFSIHQDAWTENSNNKSNVDGVNNMNTVPFANIPYQNINSIGKQWIRRFALALTKEMLGHVRGKFSTIPIPGESVTLNASDLLSQAKEEQDKLREELKTTLDELTYAKLAELDAAKVDSVNNLQKKVPMTIFVG